MRPDGDAHGKPSFEVAQSFKLFPLVTAFGPQGIAVRCIRDLAANDYSAVIARFQFFRAN